MKDEENFKIFTGNIVHCIEKNELELIENGFIIVNNTKIISIGKLTDLDLIKKKLNVKKFDSVKLKSSQLLIPGFIDTHIHAVQYPNCGLGYDKTLLEWLNDYTYPLEKKMENEEFSAKIFHAVVKKTLSHGTTTAMYFASLYENISMILVNSVIKHGQRALIGKINMTLMAPKNYIENEKDSIDNTIKFVKMVKSLNNPLVKPVVTPRFALSVDMKLMKQLGKIARDEDLHIQTHISENVNEVKLVEQLYGKSYAEVYDEAGLLTPKTILAHGVYLTDKEISLISSRGTGIAHCPESNCYLKSGCCKVNDLMDKDINVGLGSDISGGASPSILNAMRSAITTSINLFFNTKNPTDCLDWKRAFYLATLGGAKTLKLDDKIGNFEEGKDFDALIIDVNVENSSCDYLIDVTPLEILQKLIFTGDDRNIINVYVAGTQLK